MRHFVGQSFCRVKLFVGRNFCHFKKFCHFRPTKSRPIRYLTYILRRPGGGYFGTKIVLFTHVTFLTETWVQGEMLHLQQLRINLKYSTDENKTLVCKLWPCIRWISQIAIHWMNQAFGESPLNRVKAACKFSICFATFHCVFILHLPYFRCLKIKNM